MPEPSLTPTLILLRLLLAAVLGGVLGYERQQRGQPKALGVAGMLLVAVGSTAYMLLAQQEAAQDRSAPGRAIQSVLQGIGFLAGAVLFKGGTDVKGIKTAATIWITSAIGLAVGTGFWWFGAIVGVTTLGILYVTDLFPAGGRQGEDGTAAGKERGES